MNWFQRQKASKAKAHKEQLIADAWNAAAIGLLFLLGLLAIIKVAVWGL